MSRLTDYVCDECEVLVDDRAYFHAAGCSVGGMLLRREHAALRDRAGRVAAFVWRQKRRVDA